jgi:uncharacterized membrane protein
MDFDRTISIVILICLVVGIVGIIYMTLNPTETDGFTEFYLLGSNGKATDYPTNLSTGEKGNVTIGVVNHEYSTTNYMIKIKQNNTTLKKENISLQNNEKKEIFFEFPAGNPGEYKIEFDLYKLPDTQNIYRSVFLLVNVH